MLSRWIFKGIGSPESACRVHFTTWRLSIDVQDLSPVYEQRSTTNGNTARIGVANDSESVIAYELARPVRVQPGDVIGVEMPMCTLLDTYHNVLSLNVSETKSRFSYGYRRFGNSGTSFNLESPSVYQERGYQPLINVDMGKQVIV